MKVSLIFPAIVLVVQRTSMLVYALLILAGLVLGGVFLGVLGNDYFVRGRKLSCQIQVVNYRLGFTAFR